MLPSGISLYYEFFGPRVYDDFRGAGESAFGFCVVEDGVLLP